MAPPASIRFSREPHFRVGLSQLLGTRKSPACSQLWNSLLIQTVETSTGRWFCLLADRLLLALDETCRHRNMIGEAEDERWEFDVSLR